MGGVYRKSRDKLSLVRDDNDDNFNHDKDRGDNMSETDRKDNFDHNSASIIDNIDSSAAASGPSGSASDNILIHNEDECDGTRHNQSDTITSELNNRLLQSCGSLRLRLPLTSGGCSNDNDNELIDNKKTIRMVVKSQVEKHSHDDNNDNLSSSSSSQCSDESGSIIKTPRGKLYHIDTPKSNSFEQKDDKDLGSTLKQANLIGSHHTQLNKEDKNSIELQLKLSEWQSIDGEHQSTMSGCYGSYTRSPSLQNNSYDKSVAQGSNSRKSSITAKLKRESHRPSRSDGYSRLGYPSKTKISKSSALLQKLKRLLLLLAIVALCSFVLWKIYEATVDDVNYLGFVISPSILGQYNSYAVSTDAKPCAKIGSALLAKGGSAVDAAIGTLLCMGVVLPNSLGLGGGCLMTLYDHNKKEATVIDGRETAPDFAREDMFVGNQLAASRGPLSIGVPGELAAYWKAHQRFGKLNWSELFDGSIDLADNGIPMVEHLAYALSDWNHAQYMANTSLRELFINNETGKYLIEGELFVQKAMANTLKRIRDNGASEFYEGLTGQLFIDDLQKQGGRITLDNLKRYQAKVREPLHLKIDNDLHLYTQPPPGSGIVLSIILRIMHELGYYKNPQPAQSFKSSSLYYHHLSEAFKFAYAQRAALEDEPDDPKRMEELMAVLLSEEFIKKSSAKIDNVTHPPEYYGGVQYFQDDHGTAHVSVIDGQGNAAAVTTSVNLYFGAGLYSPRTGIIYNDVMDDFVSPNITNKFDLVPSKYNRIRPGKRPLSSMAPSVFTDDQGNVRLVVGASGGSKITTAIAMVSLRNLFLGENIKSSIDGPRIHHQYLPNAVWYEPNFPPSLLQSLGERNHMLKKITGRSSVVMALASDQIDNKTRKITANSDYRKGGTVDGN